MMFWLDFGDITRNDEVCDGRYDFTIIDLQELMIWQKKHRKSFLWWAKLRWTNELCWWM